MGSFANPVFAYGLVPGGMNPTGNRIPNLASTLTSHSGANPLLPSANLSPNAPKSTNPFDIVPTGTSPTAMTTPSFPANAGPFPSSTNLGTAGGPSGTQFGGFLSGMTQKDIGRLFSSLKKTYGDGMAHLLLDFLMGGAGFNQQAVNNLLASLQPGIERGEENIIEQFSAMGNRFGSPAATGLGDFLSRVNLQEGELVTQMYEDSLNRFMEVLMGVSGTDAKRIASSPGFLDQIGSILGLVGTGAGGLEAAGVGGGSGVASSIISGLAAL